MADPIFIGFPIELLCEKTKEKEVTESDDDDDKKDTEKKEGEGYEPWISYGSMEVPHKWKGAEKV